MHQHPTTEAELDLAIANMGTEVSETLAKSILANLPGVISAHLHELGALIKYRPGRITKDTICQHLCKAGLGATVFQDSATGTTGSVSY